MEALDFFDGEFAGEDGAFEGEEGLDEAEAFGGGDGHLGRSVEFDVRGDLAGHFREAEVLNDEGIDASLGDEAELALGGLELAGENQGVHRDEALHAVFVEEGHQLGQVGFGEVVGAQAGVEFRHAEVDRVGSGGDCGAGAVPVAGGAEEFRGEVGVHGGELAGEAWNVESGDGKPLDSVRGAFFPCGQ